jgi:protein-L-isoaspartate(D-aspartate) O-methyltransferase
MACGLSDSMSADFTAERTIMVDSQVRPQDVTDLGIQDAMRTVRRETLMPAGKAWLAYADAETEYVPGRWLLRPRDVAKLLQGLRPKAGERALAIAAPYAAAVMRAMGLDVTQHDEADLKAVTGVWPLIVCEGAVSEVPETWLAAIAPGGRLGVVRRNGPSGEALIFLRSEAGVASRPLFDCTPPIMAGFERARGFVF